jgi:hypothetical protein
VNCGGSRGDCNFAILADDTPAHYSLRVAKNMSFNPVTKPSQIILDKGLVLDKESQR